MKAVWIQEPCNIQVTEVKKPDIREGEALLRILYCGICGADVASYTGNQPFTTYPRIPGHEFSAQIVEIGENERGLKAGDIVTANPYFNCGTCYSCQRGFVNCCEDNQTMGVQRDGSFSEYVAMPIERIIGGRGLSAEELALVEPFSISYHALHRTEIDRNDTLLIIGAGPIGLFALMTAKAKGAKVCVADILDGRLQLAKELGADNIINCDKNNLREETERITDKHGFDVCIEACGLPATFLSCIDCAAFAGKIILIGNGKRETSFLHSVLLKKELNVFGSRNARSDDFAQVIDWIAEGKADVMKLVSAVYPMERADEAFRALAENKGDLAKVLVKM